MEDDSIDFTNTIVASKWVDDNKHIMFRCATLSKENALDEEEYIEPILVTITYLEYQQIEHEGQQCMRIYVNMLNHADKGELTLEVKLPIKILLENMSTLVDDGIINDSIPELCLYYLYIDKYIESLN